jgi:hypothetical protein
MAAGLLEDEKWYPQPLVADISRVVAGILRRIGL